MTRQTAVTMISIGRCCVPGEELETSKGALPGLKQVKEIDNRGSHYWVARYWAEELCAQDEDTSLKAITERI